MKKCWTAMVDHAMLIDAMNEIGRK